jgi:hypothetical protein
MDMTWLVDKELQMERLQVALGCMGSGKKKTKYH